MLKPFVFLDLFRADRAPQRAMEARGGMPIHPHSGVAKALEIGENRIKELGRTLKALGDRRTASGTVPVLR